MRHIVAYRLIKRLLDIALAGLGLIALAPALIIIGLMVRIRLGAPVLFRQTRPGLNGEPFELLKFRTMKNGDGPDADRTTHFGTLLRSLSLDELPELINIVRGDMSLVGPRPLLVDYLPLYSPHQARRHEVRPGLTGLAQVSGRNQIGWDERLDLDVEYVDNVSLSRDMRILWQTVSTVLKRNGISSEDGPTMERFTGSNSAEVGR